MGLHQLQLCILRWSRYGTLNLQQQGIHELWLKGQMEAIMPHTIVHLILLMSQESCLLTSNKTWVEVFTRQMTTRFCGLRRCVDFFRPWKDCEGRKDTGQQAWSQFRCQISLNKLQLLLELPLSPPPSSPWNLLLGLQVRLLTLHEKSEGLWKCTPVISLLDYVKTTVA